MNRRILVLVMALLLCALSACALAQAYAEDKSNLKDCMTLLPLYLRAPQAERERAAREAASHG